MFKRWIQILYLAVLIVPACFCQCYASGLKSMLEKDFSQIEAAVQDVSGTDVTLDAGLANRISRGDLFSIFQKGEPLYLPDSHRILGYERKRIAVCRIIRAGRNNSVCTVISSVSRPGKGDLAIRFGELHAAFFIEGKPVAPELPEGSLKNILPWFKWLEPSAGPSPVPTSESMRALGIDVLFQVQGNKLHVYGPGMEQLRSYDLPPSFVFIEKPQAPAQERKAEEAAKRALGIKLFDFHSAELVGRLNEEALQVRICDLDGDGKLEIVYLLKHQICIAPYRRRGPLVSFKFEDLAHVCNFSLMEKSGWLCVNAALEQAGLSSKFLKYEHGSLRLIQDQINLWLDFLDTDCDGIRDTFLGQSYERERFRGRKIFRLAATDNGIEYLEQADLPGDFNVNGAVSANFDQEGCSLFYVSFDGFFKVFGRGRHIWSSLKPVVRDTKCCGPSRADLIDMSRTGTRKSGIIFNGTVSLPKARLLDSLILFSHKGQTPALYQADVNLQGRICSISVVGKDVITAVIIKGTENQKNETVLYKFSDK